MNHSAEKHLDKAASYLGKGEDWYRKAAGEIAAAKGADPALSYKKIGERLGYSQSWVRDLIQWHDRGHDGSRFTATVDQTAGGRNLRGARKTLQEAPMEVVEQIISELPRERQTAIRAAAGDEYAKARQAEDERVKNLTPAEKKEIEAAQGSITGPIDKALGGFTALRVANHIDQATDGIIELIEKRALNPEAVAIIKAALDRLNTELDVAFAMAGLEGEEITT